MNDIPALHGKTKLQRYESLVAALYQDVFRYAYWLCRNRPLAEDLVQETFLRAWRSLKSLQNDKAAKAWLFTILRRENARLYERYRPELVDIDIEGQAIEENNDNEPDSKMDRELLHNAINRLENEYREPLLLQVIGAFSGKEIADILELNNNTVTLCGGPYPAEIAFGSEVIQHLYHEVNEINSINDDTELSTVSVPVVVEVMAQADTQFNEEKFLSAMPVRFAKPCVVLPEFQSAHLMLHGNHGAVSVIVINNEPVTTEYSIRDGRFQGVVVPMSKGNLILIGEQDENVDSIKSLFAQNVSWSI